MNLPNKLTIIRMILILPFVVCLLWGQKFLGGAADYVALAIFIIASLTDMADGKIARKYNLITNFGKFMDPLADKLLVSSAMICLVELGRIPSWIVIIAVPVVNSLAASTAAWSEATGRPLNLTAVFTTGRVA